MDRLREVYKNNQNAKIHTLLPKHHHYKRLPTNNKIIGENTKELR